MLGKARRWDDTVTYTYIPEQRAAVDKGAAVTHQVPSLGHLMGMVGQGQGFGLMAQLSVIKNVLCTALPKCVILSLGVLCIWCNIIMWRILGQIAEKQLERKAKWVKKKLGSIQNMFLFFLKITVGLTSVLSSWSIWKNNTMWKETHAVCDGTRPDELYKPNSCLLQTFASVQSHAHLRQNNILSLKLVNAQMTVLNSEIILPTSFYYIVREQTFTEIVYEEVI